MPEKKDKEQIAWYIIYACVAIIVFFLILSRVTHEPSHQKHEGEKNHHTMKMTTPSPQILLSQR